MNARSAVWHAMRSEIDERCILTRTLFSVDAAWLAKQISAAAMTEDLWRLSPVELAKKILDSPFEIPERSLVFSLNYDLTLVELLPELDEEPDQWCELFRPRFMNGRFRGKGIET